MRLDTKSIMHLPRLAKQLIALFIDAIMFFFATWVAFCLRFDHVLSVSEPIIRAALVSIFIGLPIFFTMGLYKEIIRYSGWFAVITLIRVITVYTLIYFLIFTIVTVNNVPRSLGLIQPLILFLCICASRLLVKRLFNSALSNKSLNKTKSLALIYGAGSAGRQLASALRQNIEFKVVGFIDDNQNYWNNNINGLRVYSPDDIPMLMRSNPRIATILLAIPSASRSRRREILEKFSDFRIQVRIIPGLNQIANGVVNVDSICDVEIEDVLGRDPVNPNVELMHQNIRGKVVLVTGAGGSIGTELCRQVFNQKPAALILFELNEFALYCIEKELSLKKADSRVVSILGSVLDESKIQRVIQQFGVQTIYHAAAYKHLPIIESNPAAGVLNNIFGTLRTLDASYKFGVETFVLISTDKAVRPTSVMGCTKRIAELILQAQSTKDFNCGDTLTKATIVRFGNVLGSSGSVVPLFREQIKNGGPVTVTHPEIIRYFMTIPEAAELVIQAGAMGEGGDVMVLDMGAPIKITDLAKKMIHLSGLTLKDELNPHGDIEIHYTGLRPGEKLYEELLIGQNTLSTYHSRIMRELEFKLTWNELSPILNELEIAIMNDNNSTIRHLLHKAVPEFNP